MPPAMKKKLVIAFLCVFLLLAGAGCWLWWARPEPVEMARLVPAETLVYLEADSLPAIVGGIGQTSAWKELAPLAGLSAYAGDAQKLSRLPFYTGLGDADTVIFSRAQVAVAVLGFEATEAGEGFKVKPHVALVVDTRSSAERTRAVVEKYAGQLARQIFDPVVDEQHERDGFHFTTWKAARGGERQIIAATAQSIGVIGNDEAAVLRCLDVIRGQKQSLAENQQMQLMRQRMRTGDSVAFGYASPVGLTKLVESVTHAYTEKVTDQRAQGLTASLLPQISGKIIGSDGAGWSARFIQGAVEDRYFISLQPGLTDQLRKTAKISGAGDDSFARLLPTNTYQVTRYPFQSPESAWRALNASLASRLDAFSSVLVTELLKNSLEPYGIQSPADFLRAAGPGVVVARLDDTGSSTVTVVSVDDEKTLRALVAKRLGARAKTIRVGDADLILSADEERGAASFVDGYLLLGSEKTLRSCLAARSAQQTLRQDEGFRRALGLLPDNSTQDAVTISDDRENARTAMAALTAQRDRRAQLLGERDNLRALSDSVSLTKLTEAGVERTTTSAFGQFGNFLAQFSSAAK